MTTCYGIVGPNASRWQQYEFSNQTKSKQNFEILTDVVTFNLDLKMIFMPRTYIWTDLTVKA